MQLRQMLFVSGVMAQDHELIGGAVGLARALGARLSALAVVREKVGEDEIAARRTQLQQGTANAQLGGPLPVLVEAAARHGDVVRQVVVEDGYDCIALATPGRRQFGGAIATRGFAPVLRSASVPLVALPQRYQPPAAISKVLLLADSSQGGQRVFDHTLELCQRLGAALDLLHVFDVEQPAEQTAERAAAASPRALIEIDQRHLSGLQERARAVGVAASGTFLEGATDVAVAKYAAEQQPDLLVLPHRGARRVGDIFSGTLTERLLGRIPCPVVLVRTVVEAIGDRQ